MPKTHGVKPRGVLRRFAGSVPAKASDEPRLKPRGDFSDRRKFPGSVAPRGFLIRKKSRQGEGNAEQARLYRRRRHLHRLPGDGRVGAVAEVQGFDHAARSIDRPDGCDEEGGALLQARRQGIPRPDRNPGARHHARHQHPAHRPRRQGRHDHHQGLPRQHRDPARHQADRRVAVQSVHSAQRAADPALAAHRRRGAHALQRRYPDSAQRAGGARRDHQPQAKRKYRIGRDLLPAFLHQSGA